MIKLGVIVASTREGRVGLPIAEWFMGLASTDAALETSLIDLKTIDLPLLSEPEHPRLKRYSQAKTQSWSELVSGFDTFVFVTPEYNFGAPPALINALDHLYQEWNYKPAGFVSYGGVSGGTRSVAMTKMILTTLKMVPIVEAVAIPFFTTHMDKESGRFNGDEPLARSAQAMLKELARWANALRPLRG